MNKIYVFISRTYNNGDVVGLAIAEDGTELASHISSSIAFAKHDMGITSDRKHELYARKYPAGFEIEWVDDWKTHPFLSEQAEKNKQEAQKFPVVL